MRRNVCGPLASLFLVIGTLLTLTSAHSESSGSENAVLTLDHGWQFRQITAAPQTPDAGWMPATVPGDVHLDLFNNKKIPDPFYRDNESKLQWIENASWEYRLSFDVAPAILARSNVDLVFDGLDAAAQVEVNGAQVLSANNMFRTWRIPAKGHLHAGSNQLRIVLPSPIKAAEQAAALDPWQPRTRTAAKTYVRKAAYEYGWDWGPRFVTSGIWRPVRIEAWDKARIADLAIRQRDVSREVAHLDAQVEIESTSLGSARVTVSYLDAGKPVTLTTRTELHLGTNVIDVPVQIRQPRLWYPAGYGDQPLYEFNSQLVIDGKHVDQRNVKSGLRSVVLRRDVDQWGRSFEFDVNGIPVFAKGADVIPFDSFPNRVTTANYRRILQSARDANMNMVRHWGGGYYETDEFYSICDELGLMVWQDFMFGNDWQPGTYDFKQNISQRAVESHLSRRCLSGCAGGHRLRTIGKDKGRSDCPGLLC